MITLREVTSHNWRKTLMLSVNDDQQPLVADYAPIALVGLAKAYVRPMDWRWLPYAIYDAETMVGFLQLAIENESAEWCWLFHFFIDQQQNKGNGTKAVKKLIELVSEQYPDCHTLCLTVHPDNVRCTSFIPAWVSCQQARWLSMNHCIN